MAVGDVYQVSVGVGALRQRAVVTFWVEVTTDDVDPTNNPNKLIDLFISFVQPKMIAVMSSSANIDCYKVQKLFPGETEQAVQRPITPVPGLRGVGNVSLSASIKIRYYSLVFTKKGRSRKYFPGVSKADQDQGTLTPALATAINDLGLSTSGNATTGPGDFAVRFGVANLTDEVFNPFTEFQRSGKVWSIKTRALESCF